MVAVSSTAVMSVRCVIASSMVASLKSKMFEIMSLALSPITPVSSPWSTIMRISSSVTVCSSLLGSYPINLSTKLVDAVRKEINGWKMEETAFKMPENLKESDSARCMAIFFGTNSPKINEK